MSEIQWRVRVGKNGVGNGGLALDHERYLLSTEPTGSQMLFYKAAVFGRDVVVYGH